jgi:CRP/FNR family cyclic AMP-dependent transcriptional regulator
MTAASEVHLLASPLFAALGGQPALADLAAACELHRAGAGEVVVSEGTEGDTMYVITRGRVRVEKRTRYQDTYTVTFLGPGEFFGEVALLNRDRRSATCLAESDCEFVVISRERFLAFGDRHPASGLLITRKIADRLADRLLKANEDIITLFSALVEEVEGAVLLR